MGGAARSGLTRRNLRSLDGGRLVKIAHFRTYQHLRLPRRAPLLGLFFWGTSGRELGEQFCTDGYCQGVQARMSGHGRVLISETDQFWEYAKEAILLACDAKTAKDKQDLLELSGTWTQAALES